MPYGNPIVAGTTLVREAIQSGNYVPGVSGWSINRDGFAEFSGAVFRGDVLVGPGSPADLVITETIPAELVAAYDAGSGYTQLNYVILEYTNNGTGTYFYELVATLQVGAGPISRCRIRGVVFAGEVVETSRDFVQRSGTVNSYGQTFGPLAYPSNGGVGTTTPVFAAQRAVWNFGAQGDPQEDLQYDGVSLPRGIVYWEQITAPLNSGAVAGTEYAVWISAAAIDCQPGRAYRLHFINGKIKDAGGVQTPAINVREGASSPPVGTVLTQGPRYPIDDANADLPFGLDFAWCNSTAALISTKVTLTITPSAARAVTFDAGPGAQAVYAVVQDIGSTARASGLVTV